MRKRTAILRPMRPQTTPGAAASHVENPPEQGSVRRVLFVAGRTHLPDGSIPPHGSGAHVAATRAGLERHFTVAALLGTPGAAGGGSAGSRLRRVVPGRIRGLRQDVLLLAHELRLARRALRSARELHADAVYERSEYLSFAGLAVARRLRLPYVLEVDGLVEDDVRTQYRSLAEPLGPLVERLKRRRAAAIVVESPGMAAALERRGTDSAKLVIAPNALPAERVRAEPRAARSGPVTIGWIGHLMPWYVDALALLVRVAPCVLEAAPDTRFEIVAGGPGLPEIQALVDAGGLAPRFMLRGPVPYEQVPAVLEDFDVGVIPALFDYQFPVKLVELGGAGLPVVAPSTSSVDGLLARGVEYEPFSPGDPDDLARALVRLATDAARREELGRALREAVRTRFTWPVVSDRLAAAVERAAQGSRG